MPILQFPCKSYIAAIVLTFLNVKTFLLRQKSLKVSQLETCSPLPKLSLVYHYEYANPSLRTPALEVALKTVFTYFATAC